MNRLKMSELQNAEVPVTNEKRQVNCPLNEQEFIDLEPRI